MIRVEQVELKIQKKFLKYFKSLGYTNENNIKFILSNNLFVDRITFNISYKQYGFNVVYSTTRRYQLIENIWQDLIDSFNLNLGKNVTIFINRSKLDFDQGVLLHNNDIDNELINYNNHFINEFETKIISILKKTEDIKWMDQVLNTDPLDFETPCKYFTPDDLIFKKIIVARLANNPMFEEIYMTIKKMYEDYLKNNSNEKYSNELNVLNILFERLKTIEPLKNPKLI
ncbi:MAG: hypothetical protein LBL58_00170 [Tannerellaceae bacterium]|jgi:hypothetical protein|nr:hypothetical protein [Tannerellaceae bacterium]